MKKEFLRSRLGMIPALAVAASVVIVFAVVATGGCGSSSTTPSTTSSPTPSPSHSPTPTPSPTTTPTAVNFVIMRYAKVTPTADPVYGQVDGFGTATAAPSSTPLPTVVSQVVNVHCNQTIAFYNLDPSISHTASSQGSTAPPPWPTWQNVYMTDDTTPQYTGGQLTPITYPNFTTGTLQIYPTTGWNSLVYSTGSAAGLVILYDWYEYAALANPPMRTVVNIACP